ncbi:Uncharacterized protein TCM_004260 [Theobroma cacao]|uniref:Integrase catalytic domain-containing protein n=1 Tax=Theobroma cacao TaxID=3641 RepID=A0A061DPK1_THECC|nr:Uncharacterized protein TCM_004260 [Theobroma cacao]
MLTKITRNPFPKVKRNTKLLELIHSDVCDMHSTPTLTGKKYFVAFIDDFSKYCYVYLLHSKDEVLDKFKVYKSKVELQYEYFIKCLRSDRGGKYYSPSYFASTGIIHHILAPYTLQHNGAVEKKNRVLTEMVTAMLSYSGLGKGNYNYYNQFNQMSVLSKRVRKVKDFDPDFYMFIVEGTRENIDNKIPYCFNLESDPISYDEAMKSQDFAF